MLCLHSVSTLVPCDSHLPLHLTLHSPLLALCTSQLHFTAARLSCPTCHATTRQYTVYDTAIMPHPPLQALCLLGVLLTTVVYSAVFNALSDGLNEQFTLSSPSSPDFGRWSSSLNPDAPTIYTIFYVYNITNPDGYANGEIPQLEEIGPLTYYYMQQKYNVTWYDACEGRERACMMSLYCGVVSYPGWWVVQESRNRR